MGSASLVGEMSPRGYSILNGWRFRRRTNGRSVSLIQRDDDDGHEIVFFVRRSTWIESTGMIPSITTSAAYRKRCLRSRNTVGCMAHYCRTQGGVQCLAAAPRLSRSVVILTRGREVSIRQSRDAFGPTFCPDRIRSDHDRIGIVDFPGPCPCPCRPSRQNNLGTAKRLRELYFSLPLPELSRSFTCPCPIYRPCLSVLPSLPPA